LKDRTKAFEVFRQTYHKNEAIESNKEVLKAKYDEAKAVGEAVNTSRSKISHLKSKIEQLRVERAMRGEGGDAAEQDDPEELRLKSEIDGFKNQYKDKFNRLRELKAEIEHIQGIMEKQRHGMQKDFENWYNLMIRQHKAALKGGPPAPGAAGPAAPAAASSPKPRQSALAATVPVGMGGGGGGVGFVGGGGGGVFRF